MGQLEAIKRSVSVCFVVKHPVYTNCERVLTADWKSSKKATYCWVCDAETYVLSIFKTGRAMNSHHEQHQLMIQNYRNWAKICWRDLQPWYLGRLPDTLNGSPTAWRNRCVLRNHLVEIEAVDHSEHASFGILYDYTKCFDYDLERNLPWPVPRLLHGYGWYGTNSLLPSSGISYWNFFHHRGNKSERVGMGRYSCQTVVLLGLHGRSCVWKDHSRKASISRSWLNKSKDPWAKFTKFKESDVAMTATPVVQPRPAAKVQPVVAALATWLYPFITFLTMAYNII